MLTAALNIFPFHELKITCRNESNRFTSVCQGSVSGLLERKRPQMILRQTFSFIFDDALTKRFRPVLALKTPCHKQEEGFLIWNVFFSLNIKGDE